MTNAPLTSNLVADLRGWAKYFDSRAGPMISRTQMGETCDSAANEIERLQLAVTAAHAERTRELGQMRRDFSGVVEEEARLRAALKDAHSKARQFLQTEDLDFVRSIMDCTNAALTRPAHETSAIQICQECRSPWIEGDGYCRQCGHGTAVMSGGNR